MCVAGRAGQVGVPFGSSQRCPWLRGGPWLRLVSGTWWYEGSAVHTWFGDADSDISALELRAREVKSLLQALDGAKLDISEAFRLSVQLVLDNANVSDLAAGEEVVHVALGGVEGQIAQVGGIRGLGGEGELLAHGESAVGWTNISASRAGVTRVYPPKLSARLPPKPPPEPYEGRSPP